ncbi:putative RNA-directed DNA polymerase [Helianthus annuus]|nr:putative RNA-directed DNA polymerase [Helianthus annuus]
MVEHQEKEKLYEFLMGLDNEFGVIKTQILATKPTPALGTAYHLVAEDERQKQITEDKKPSMETAAFKAFVPQNRNSPTSSQQKPKAYSKPGKQEEGVQHCTHCDRDGHSSEGCFKLIGYPEWWPNKMKGDKAKPRASCVEGNTSPIPGLTKEQYDSFLKHFKGGADTNNEGNERVANMTGRLVDEDDWVVDSGATEHTTYLNDILSNKRKDSHEVPVTIPNGDTIPVEGKGDYTLPGGTRIRGILHVPKFTCNLLSVSRLTKDLQCSVTFFPDFCVMQGLRSRNLIGAGKCKGGLYRMGMFGEERKAMAVTVERWCNRLGHTSQEKLAKIEFLKGVSFNLRNNVCDSCSKAKHTRSPFPLSEIKTKECFELLHCDVWGKYRIPSYSGANYFLTIVDDFSRNVWIFLIKYKSDASNCLMNFCKMVETQFSKIVKRIRCDNGGEFTSNLMLSFYTKQGILLETTCPHTPQQNGVVERKHRHLLDTARALRFEANLPKRFWGECVLTAAYIINRLPSKTLDDKTPYEILYNQKPEYDHMRVFGCLTYFWSIETKGDKFEVRGRPGIFLGYPQGTKGYKIFDIQDKKMIVSRDVKFHETTFTFPVEAPIANDYDVFVPLEAQHTQGPDNEETSMPNRVTSDGPEPISESNNNNEEGPSPVDEEVPSSNHDIHSERPKRDRAPPKRLNDFVVDLPPSVDHAHTASTRATSTVHPSTNYISYDNFSHAHKRFLAAITSTDEPKSFKQAMQNPKWIEAMKKEIQALEENNTWTIESCQRERGPLTPNGCTRSNTSQTGTSKDIKRGS